MRQFPFRPLIAVVALILIVVLVRTFACSSEAPKEAQEPTIADPTWTDCRSENQQVILSGFYLNQAESASDTAQVYVLMELRAQGSGSATVDAYLGDSLIRFATINDSGEFSEVTSSSTAAAFGEKGYKTTSYSYSNTIQGETILSKEATRLVAVFEIDRSDLEQGNTMSLWFDYCNAVYNNSSNAVANSNVILSIPTEYVRELADEAAILKKATA